MTAPADMPPLSKARRTLLRKLKMRKHRRDEGLFVAEGVRLVEEAAGSDIEIVWVVCADTGDPRSRSLVDRLAADGVAVCRAELGDLKDLLDPVSPQPVAAVCRIPERGLPDIEPSGRELLVLCDSIRDPGNFGAVARTAVAAGCSGIVAAAGTVDPWNPKAVRGSMGALFRLPVAEVDDPARLREHLDRNGFAVYSAEMDGSDVFALDEVPDRCALLLGGEAAGPASLARTLHTAPLAVPMAPGVESLNVAVAAGIILYRLAGLQRETTR